MRDEKEANAMSRSMPDIPLKNPNRYQIWIDGCAGFLALLASEITLGCHSSSSDSLADIAIVANLSRCEGKIQRRGSDDFWIQEILDESPKLLQDGDCIETKGSAIVHYARPSQLSESSVLTMRSPHRFAGHVDQILLVRDGLIIGPESDCHLRCDALDSRFLLIHRGKQWMVRSLSDDRTSLLQIGVQQSFDDLSLTIEMG
ncbi:hypothetical protein OAL35_00605 [bacterium]|nr:hypothetical protein [bacterium]